MARIAVRRRRASDLEPATATAGVVVFGLALGATLGFLLGELIGPAAAGAITRRPRPSAKRSVAEMVHDAQAALDDDVVLREARLEVVPVGRDALELHGWVTDRPSRTRAARLVTEQLGAGAVINCLLVRGEDDLDDELFDDLEFDSDDEVRHA